MLELLPCQAFYAVFGFYPLETLNSSSMNKANKFAETVKNRLQSRVELNPAKSCRLEAVPLLSTSVRSVSVFW